MGNSFVEFGFKGRKGVVDGVGFAFREEECAIKSHEFFFDHAAHDIGDFDFVNTVAEFSIEAVGIKEGEEELEVGFFAVVWGGGHQKEMPCMFGEFFREKKAFCGFDLIAEVVCCEFMGFIKDDEIPR